MSKLSKIEYWKKFDLHNLFSLLHSAEKILVSNITFESNSKIKYFRENFIEELYEKKFQNVADFTRMWNWFDKNNEWTNATNNEREDLRIKIFKILDFWKRNQEFISGTKLRLDNENGVVTNKTSNGLYGLIRWDTNNEDDFEDWFGLFGTFLDLGGEILEQEFEFKYIDDKGNLKNGCR